MEEEDSLLYRSHSGTWLRSVKRKLQEFDQGNAISTPEPAKVDVANECVELREMSTNQQKAIQDLTLELEEERNASSTAANEAMSMIIRLQHEKAETQMEARQFKRITEEKMTHNQLKLSAMEELLYKKDQTIQSLNCEVQAYKHRMMSYGLTESEADGDQESATMSRHSSQSEIASQTDLYSPHKCILNGNQTCSEIDYDIDKYTFCETPRSGDHLKDLEFRINQLERSPRTTKTTHPEGDMFGGKTVFEKIVSQSPRRPRHFRRVSTGSSNSIMATIKETSVELTASAESSPKFSNLRKMVKNTPEIDDTSDRVYTINVVSNSETKPPPPPPPVAAAHNNVDAYNDKMNNTSKESVHQANAGDEEVKQLYMRLQALEADRESMRQSIISMRTEKAQMVLLKEVAQHMCKDMSSAPRLPASKQSLASRFSILSIFKWIASIVLWRKRARRSKYIFGTSNSNSGPGLLMVLETTNNVPRRQGRYLSSIHVV